MAGCSKKQQCEKNFNAEWAVNPVNVPKWAIGPFAKYKNNPLLAPAQRGWESRNVYNPAVAVLNGKFYMLYRAENRNTPRLKGCFYSVLGLAVSDDGLNWQRYQDTPIISGTEVYEWPSGCEDPRLFKYKDTFHLWYTGVHVEPTGEYLVADQCHATSKDMVNWRKHGPRGMKNDSVVTNPQLEAVKVNGKFLLYNDKHIAYSDDLISWDVKQSAISDQIPDFRELCQVMTDVPGYEDYIIMLAAALSRDKLKKDINELSINKGNHNKKEVEETLHTVLVQVLFSKKNPEKVIEISEPIFYPTELYELEGTFGPGRSFPCVFVNQGLFLHKNEWWLYYGGSDHVICLAKAPLKK